MITSFLVNAAMFIIKRAKGKGTRYSSFFYLALKFYKEAVIHLPFVVTFNNLWRMKMLHDLNYGTRDFKMKDHKMVEEILAEAGIHVRGWPADCHTSKAITNYRLLFLKHVQICKSDVYIYSLIRSYIHHRYPN